MKNQPSLTASYKLQKKLFQVILSILLIVPFGFGTVGVLFGLRGFYWIFGLSIPASLDVNLDNDFRFLAGVFLGIGFLIVRYIVKDIEKQTGLFRVIALSIFIGGVGRIISWTQLGKPNLLSLLLIASEIVIVPLLVLWQTNIARLALKIAAHNEEDGVK